jgi:alpha-L-fucosidase
MKTSSLSYSKWMLMAIAFAAVACEGFSQTEVPSWKDPAWQETTWKARGCFDDQRGQWFRAAKFGAFIHFGPYSQLGGYWQGKGPYRPAEQIIGLGERKAVIPADQYRKEVGGAFNPTNFNAREWVSAIKRAGQKYIIVTTKHHDGFCMFRTATTTHNIVDATPFARDVIKELAGECKKQGIEFCPYYSIGDWCAAEVRDPKFKSYKDYMYAQLQELLTNYGDVKMLWFDNYWYVDNQWRNDPALAKELYAYVRSLSPHALVNDRCGRGVSSTDGDYATPENQLKGSRQSRYFEVVMTDTDDDNWGWVKGATNYRSPTEVIRNLIDCTSKGGNFVLNVGPTSTGEFPAEHLAILDVVGKWMTVNGEAIYDTVPAPECVADENSGFKFYATKRAGNIYLHVVKWPSDGKLASVRIHRSGWQKAEWLDDSLPAIQCASTMNNDGTMLQIKAPSKADPYATVVKLAFKNDSGK